MKHIRNAMGILAGVAIFVGIVHILNYLYKPTDDNNCRLIWHHYYEEEGKITNLYLGSSHMYRDVDPRILNEMTGEYNFDLGSPGQILDGTFYLLREAERNNELKHVYVEMYYMCGTKDNFNKDKDPIDGRYTRNWQNTDNMRISINKLAYMLSCAESDQYIDILLPFSRYRAKLGDWKYVKNNIGVKNTEEYLAYRHDSENETGAPMYLEHGFFGSTKMFTDQFKCYCQERILEENPMGEKSKQYLCKIIRYCQKRDIPITLFISPIYELRLISTMNYDNYTNEVRDIAEEYGIPFYDFNLAREEYLPIQYGEYFTDGHHLNSAGAEMFTSFLGHVIQQEESENEEYFYDSYAEKLREASPAIYGIYYRDIEDTDEITEITRTMYVASNRDEGMEYRIILTPEEGEQYMVQDFEQNKEFTVPEGETGICTIVARMTDAPNDVVQTMEIDY